MALRNGLPKENDKESVTPYEGYNHEILEKSKRSSVSLVKLFRDYKDDFDANVAKPTGDRYFKREGNIRAECTHYEINLENIDSSWVTHYMENVMFSMRNNKTGRERIYREQSRDQVALADDDNDYHEELDFAVDDMEERYSPIELEHKRKKLRYLIKRLSWFGATYNFHMMSLVIAHEKAKKDIKKNYSGNLNRNGGKAKQQDILKYGYFAGDNLGGYLKSYDDTPIIRNENKGAYAEWIHNFIIGRDITGNEEYYDDYINLLEICRDLKIDLTKENPEDYTGEFVSDLAVTYIVDNKDYMRKVKKRCVVQDEIRNFKLSDYAQPVEKVVSRRNIESKIITESQLISLNIMKFNNTSEPKVLEYKSIIDNTKVINEFLGCFKDVYSEVQLVNENTLYVNGFIADERTGKIATYPAAILRKKSESKVSEKFIIHRSGVAVLLRSDSQLQFCLPEMYTQYIYMFMNAAITKLKMQEDLIRVNYLRVLDILKDNQYAVYRKGYGFWPVTSS